MFLLLSRIIDANMAVESAELVKKQILSQAGNFVLSAAFRNKNAVLGHSEEPLFHLISDTISSHRTVINNFLT